MFTPDPASRGAMVFLLQYVVQHAMCTTEDYSQQRKTTVQIRINNG